VSAAAVRRLRLASGLVLLAYLLTHYANHALGLVSLGALENGRVLFLPLWRNPVGTAALYGALGVHALLALWRLWERRTLRMPAWEATQTALGLLIPPLLAGHIVGNRGAHAWLGVNDTCLPDRGPDRRARGRPRRARAAVRGRVRWADPLPLLAHLHHSARAGPRATSDGMASEAPRARGPAVSGSRPVRIIRSLRRLVEQRGLAAIHDLVGPLSYQRQRIGLFALDVSPGYAPPPLDPRVEIRAATPQDLAALRASPEGERSEFYRDRLDGAEPWVALWEGQPVHICWAYDHARPSPLVRLRPGEVELRFAYTLTAFRGRRLYGMTNAVMAADLARRGCSRVWGVVVDHDPTFRRGRERALTGAGFRLMARTTYLRVLGIQLRPRLSV
jgi:hypothetical protein